MAAQPEAVAALVEAYRLAQQRRAAALATLVVAWWRQRVRQDDPASIDRWLNVMVPRIVAAHAQSATLGGVFYGQLRKLEVPGAAATQIVRPDPLEPDRVRASLIATGPAVVRAKLAEFDKMTLPSAATQVGVDANRTMLEQAVREEAAKQITGPVIRHALNGGRSTIQRTAEADRTALGWVRVTDADPCYFCAMLASRGLESGSYEKDSFDRSDGRFTGPGDAKVHDHCSCSLKPVYRAEDPYLAEAERYAELWREHSTGSSAEAIRTFRRGYEGRKRAA